MAQWPPSRLSGRCRRSPWHRLEHVPGLVTRLSVAFTGSCRRPPTRRAGRPAITTARRRADSDSNAAQAACRDRHGDRPRAGTPWPGRDSRRAAKGGAANADRDARAPGPGPAMIAPGHSSRCDSGCGPRHSLPKTRGRLRAAVTVTRTLLLVGRGHPSPALAQPKFKCFGPQTAPPAA